MSASRPGSVMLRAATAASGGTGAPDWTYCSIWAWTVRTSAWTSTPSGFSSVSTSTARRMYGSFSSNEEAQALLALDDGTHRAVLRLHDLGDLRQRADRVELARLGDVLALGLALRHEGDRPTSATAASSGFDGLVAADLERHDHLREDDGLAQRDERQHADRAVRSSACWTLASSSGWPTVLLRVWGRLGARRGRRCRPRCGRRRCSATVLAGGRGSR